MKTLSFYASFILTESFWNGLPKALTSILLKSWVCARKPINLNELHQSCQEECSNIQPELWQKLVDGNQKSLVEVQLSEGHLTKHQSQCIYILDPVWITQNPK